MGLSESEKRVLEELERGLYAEDAAFARKSKAQIERIEAPGANSPAKVIAGSLMAVVGISLLVFGAVTQFVVFGVAGFLVMLIGILIASATGGRSMRPAKSQKPGAVDKPNRSSMFEERWNKRTEQ
jgi:predicted lipid-binding transport protein (Tim44 family)